MRTEPPDIDRTALARLLEREWVFRAASLEYLPVGFGSHHWEASDGQGARRFVTADRLTNSRAGADQDAAYVVTLFPFLDGRSTSTGDEPPADEHRLLLRMLGRLHAAAARVPPDLAPREDFEIPHRDSLLEAVGDLDRPWTSGPFAEPTRELLRRSAGSLARRLESYDELANDVRRTPGAWVVTHGEPHSANVMRDGRGGLVLVDWDTVCLAPRERDLWMVLDSDASGWSDYLSTAGTCSLDDRALRLYRSRWDLADIAAFVHLFRHAHEEAEDTVEAWGYLNDYL